MNNLRPIKRKVIRVSEEHLIRAERLNAEKRLPLLIEPVIEGIDILNWARQNQGFIDEQLLKHGGLLFRDFKVKSAGEFEQFIKITGGELLEYRERSSPRTQVTGNVYTSTDHPPDQSIFPHNENSYQHTWPLRIFFYCQKAPQQGGETPIVDCRNILHRIDPEIRNRFDEKKWMYVRNFGDGLGLEWQTVFQTDSRAAVEEHCLNNGIECEWKEGNRLRTRAIRPVIARHPVTGEQTWFNHLTFFHVSTLEPSIGEALQAEFKEEDLPANTYYGDGSPIEDDVMDKLREAYRQETIEFTWKEGDILMLDNMFAAHGRAPFQGQRSILVGMAIPVSS